ncbi:hypothetical protein ABPG74_003939 [Tetrahymena malaccensis]
MDFGEKEVQQRDENFEPPQLQIPDITNDLKQQDTILKNKIADNEDNTFNKYLYYYRQRIDVFEDERSEWLQKIEEIKENLKDKHQLEAQLKQLVKTIGDIQQSITEQKLSTFSERIAYLNLSRLNADLKIKDVQNRKKIAELIALTEPKKNTTVVYKNLLPNGERGRNIENDLNIYQQTNQKRTVQGNDFQRSQITTVYFPNENLNCIVVENESLKSQQQQERQIFQSQFEALQEELKVRDEELRLKEENDRVYLNQLEKKVQDLEIKHYNLNKHYFETRRRCNDSVRKLQDEKDFLQQRHSQLQNKLEFISKQTQIENEALRDLETKKALEYTNKFQNQVKFKSEKIEVMKEQYAQIQNMYQQKARELEQTHVQLVERYNSLQQETELQKQNFLQNIEELQNEFQELQHVQNEKGLVPIKPQKLSREQVLLNQQRDLQRQLKQEKLERQKLKQKIYRETLEQQSKPRSQSKKRRQQGSQRISKDTVNEEDLNEVERQLDDLRRGLDQQLV